MKYNIYFIIIIIISSSLGLFLGIISNKLIELENNANINDIKNENEIEQKNNEINKEKEKKVEKEIEDNNKIDNEKSEENDSEDTDKIEKEKGNENQSENKNTNRSINKIAVSYATDNKYIYPTIVSMTSLVDHAGNFTFYEIYILHPADFVEYSKNFLRNVENKYKNKCKIIFINMGNKYKGLQLNFRISTPAYYRLSLHELLPETKKIVYMDGDTLVFEDLTPLFNLDMKNNVIMGFLDSVPSAIESYGIKNATVLCSGVLLMNLELLRYYNYSDKIDKFMKKNKGNLKQHDQTIINVVMQKQIAPLPPKYGMWAWMDKPSAKRFLDKQRAWLKYNEDEFFYAVEHPAILHYIWPKPFWRKKTAFEKEWWDYARKTGFYDEIYKKSPIPNIKWRI